MTAPRSDASATLLPNGKVLVAGGYTSGGNGASASADLYDPATGTWQATGSMTTARKLFPLTLLPNGKVLAAGGLDTASKALSSAELYDPATGIWTPTGSMSVARQSFTATLLRDGTVLASAGAGGGGTLSSAELYDPSTGLWRTTGSLAGARYAATATLLADGTVLVAGGSADANNALSTAEIYDPANQQWQSTPPMPSPHWFATASRLPNGQVLVVGGAVLDPSRGTHPGSFAADVYDPVTRTWRAGWTQGARRAASAVVLTSGTVLITGGMGPDILGVNPGVGPAPNELYDPATSTWSTAPQTAGRIGQTATLLPNGTVLVAGGIWQDGNGPLATALIYDPTGPAVTAITPNTGPAAGGTTVTITGSNLSGAAITFGANAASNVSCAATSCTATSPAGSGTVVVTVTTAAGSSSGEFTYQAPVPAPTISKITPTSGPAAGGTTVTVTGSNLSSGGVTFGATPASNVSCAASSCTATSPPGTGTVDVRVTTAGGTSAVRSADQFTYQAAPAAPTVTRISPTSGPAAGGTVVTITGTSLSAGTVRFGTAAAVNATCGSTSCTATSPAGTGTVDVRVTTTSGTSATGSADQFTYQVSAPTGNLVPNPGFESSATPSDYWGGKLARSATAVHSGAWSLAQTTTSASGGWDLDSDRAWYAPVATGKSYTAVIWVRATKVVKVDLNVDLLTSTGKYVTSADGPVVTLAANTWTQLTVTGIKPGSTAVYAAMEPNFSAASTGTVIYWDDLSLSAT